MKRLVHDLKVISFTLILSLFLSSALTGQAGAPYALAQFDSTYEQIVEQAREIIHTHMDTVGIPGLTAAVSIDGQIVWAEGFGLADVENRVPVWPHTKMRIGSVSKSLTSIALALLYEQGKIDLDVPVQKYVPSFPKKKYPITTRQLAGHLAGIRHYRGQEFLSSQYYETVKEGLKIFQNDTLLFKPGERFRYSSYGWNLVSAVIESAAHKDFLSYMREQVFQPLGLRNTVADYNQNIIYNRTRFYVRNDKNILVNAPFVDNSYKWAGGGYLSTAGDLVHFGDMLLKGDFLKPETLKLLFTSQKTNSGKETNYGMGWFIWNLNGIHIIGHGGGSIGGTTFLGMLPDKKIVIAIICNLSGGRVFNPSVAILKLFAEHESKT